MANKGSISALKADFNAGGANAVVQNTSQDITGTRMNNVLNNVADTIDAVKADATALTAETNRATAAENAISGGISGISTTLNGHINNVANPHAVTKSQVGLGNVDNTSDADKPVSDATRDALDELDEDKASKDGYYDTLGAGYAGVAENLVGAGSVGALFTRRTSGGTADIGSGTAILKRIKGKSLVWNQRISIPSSSLSKTENGITLTDNRDGSYTINGTSTAEFNAYLPIDGAISSNAFIGHKILVVGATTNIYVRDTGNGSTGASGNVFAPYIATIAVATYIAINIPSGVTINNVSIRPNIFDLTQMFGAGNEPTTVAEFTALYNKSYYPYNAGKVIHNGVTSLVTDGFNQWDEEWELGDYDAGTGEKVADNTMIRSKNKTRCFQNTSYYFNMDCRVSEVSYAGKVFWYDANNNLISSEPCGKSANALLTSPANACYFAFTVRSEYGTTYNHDICINLSWSGIKNGQYEAHWQSSLPINAKTLTGKINNQGSSVTLFPDGMVGVGSVYDELTANANNVINGGTRRFGKRAYQSGDEGDATVITDLTNTWYPLTTPEPFTLDTPISALYKVDDFGTETAEPTATDTQGNPQTAPFSAEIQYAMNAVDTLRNLPKNYAGVAASGTASSIGNLIQALISCGVLASGTISYDSTNQRYNFSLTKQS